MGEVEAEETKAILKLVTKSHPEVPCLRPVAGANLRMLPAEASTCSPAEEGTEKVGYQVRAFQRRYSANRKTTTMAQTSTMAPRVAPQIMSGGPGGKMAEKTPEIDEKSGAGAVAGRGRFCQITKGCLAQGQDSPGSRRGSSGIRSSSSTARTQSWSPGQSHRKTKRNTRKTNTKKR